TPAGARPRYIANGPLAWAVTQAAFWGGAALGWFRPAAVYDQFGALVMASSVIAALASLAFYAKARLKPRCADARRSGFLLLDYFQGIELYPRLGRLHLK